MELIASGRDADVFALDRDRVLRRYRDGRPAAPEAEVIRGVVAAGYPAPALLGVDGPDLILERVAGPTLGMALLDGSVTAAWTAGVLARLHAELHAIAWEGGSLLHRDLHPLNVIVASGGPVVIDWSDARPGPAALDVAMTALICAEVVMTPETAPVPQEHQAAVADLLREVLVAFTTETGPAYRAHLGEAERCRRANPTLSPLELDRLADAVRLAHDAD